MRLRRAATVLAATAITLVTASPAQAAWQPAQQVNSAVTAVTDIDGAHVATADDGSAVAVWLEWRGADARVMAARRPVGGEWGPPLLVDDVSEAPGVTGGRVGLNAMVVLPRGAALISYQEYDADAGADFVGRVVKLGTNGSVSAPLLSGPEMQWRLVADAEGDWLATARQYDRCACENYTWYSDGGAAPQFLGTYLGFGLRFTLSRNELVYLAVDDDDGLYRAAHTLRVRRIDAATGSARRDVLLEPDGKVTGFDIDANTSDDVDLVWSVRHREKRRLDVVRAIRQPSGGAWSRPHTVVNSGGDGNRPLGAPQVETSGEGKALVVWSTPPNYAGRVDLDSAIVWPSRPSSDIRRLASNVDPDGRRLAFGVQVNDSGQAAVTFSQLTPCPSDPGTTCHTVSALRGRIGRLHEPTALFRSQARYESVSTALSDSGVVIVLTLVEGLTRIESRTSP